MKGFVGYEFEAVIEARKEVRDTALKNKLALKNDIRLAQEEKKRNGILQPLRPWISLR